MKKMKLCLLLLPVLYLTVVSTEKANAAEYKPVTQSRSIVSQPENDEEIIENLFSDLDDTDNVLILPDGGIAHGQVDLIIPSENEKNDEVVKEYNSEEDEQAITVAEAKSMINEQAENFDFTKPNSNPLLRKNLPTQGYKLGAGGSYRSNPFSGSGWVTSGYYFVPTAGTGNYLLWQTFLDDGVVGGYNQMFPTINGNGISGTIVYASMGKRLVLPSGNPSWDPARAYFASLNPVRGSGYWVANKNS